MRIGENFIRSRHVVSVQGVCANVRGSQGQKYLEKAGFFASRLSSICSEMLEFHKKYSLPSSQRLIFRGLARGFPPPERLRHVLHRFFQWSEFLTDCP